MKATIEYRLPEEAVAYHDAINGSEWRLVVANLDNMLRTALTHGHNLRTATEAVEAIRTRLTEETNERGLSL
jgi:hypothetical protein